MTSSARPPSHDWTRKPSTKEEEEDPLDRMISRTGCSAFHYAVQECMAEHQDWRQCQQEVQRFKDCMSKYQQRRAEELQKLRQATS
ncbi:cytochrome c oxidase assembly factor 4 homolog, mitochondrial [Heteronotia binoei]|uniref:cytochrome c oxidase assembly factor 4 homolog, mitochondrial n=1 Tax=Heteronotia binoei TaxID=13085 RepID=UPI00292D43FE|nr:cytochrome c oxidase assembly factor 4 homolog, mitochondrial [Heteronotia binoei]